MSIKLRNPGRDAALNDWRSLACYRSSHPREVVVYEFQLLLVRRFSVSLVEAGRKFTASDYEECLLRSGRCGELSEKSPVSKGYREEKDKTDQQHATTGLHPCIERRGRINQQRTDRHRPEHRKNMFRRVDQTSHFGISVVTADDVKCLQNDSEHHAVNKHDLEGTDKELVAANIADNPVKHHPPNH